MSLLWRTCQSWRGDHPKSQQKNLYLPEPGRTCYQESTIGTWRASAANAYLKIIIQNLQDYTLTIWTGRNAALHAQTQDTELIVHAQLNADIRQLYKLKD
jgi:hypothetical protein